MQKKHFFMQILSSFCVFSLITTGCASASHTVQTQAVQPEPIVDILQTDGLVYIPDRSVYFADVTQAYGWAFHEIDYLANANVISGTGDFIFSPASALSRADFILMLYRAYDMEKYEADGNFVDVPQDAYYADAVAAARMLGIAQGDKTGKFHPQAPLTRQDAMVLLKRTLDRTGLSFAAGDLSQFSDRNTVSAYASDSVAALVRAGVIEGADQKLYPKKSVTRAEMAVMLYRALHLHAIGDTAIYRSKPEMKLVCIGSTIYADASITNFDASLSYSGLYHLESLQRSTTDGYTITLGRAEPIDDTIVWDGEKLSVNGTPMPVAEDCEAIVVDLYSKRQAGLCSTGAEYTSGAISVIDGVVHTVYYKI